MPHIGTVDIDLSLDAEALGDGEYAQLVESLTHRGYRQSEDHRKFQLIRTIPANDERNDIEIIVDFLMPRDAEIAKNTPPLVPGFVVQRADGADLALRFYQLTDQSFNIRRCDTRGLKCLIFLYRLFVPYSSLTGDLATYEELMFRTTFQRRLLAINL